MAPKKVLFFGVTGYVGGSVFTRLFLARDSDEEVTILVRATEKAEKLKQYGVIPIVGDLGDGQLVEKLVSEAEVVINAADSWNIELTENILRGLEKRYEETGIKPVYIHTTGTGALLNDTRGMALSDEIWDDADAQQMALIPPDAIHRQADRAVINADEEGYCRVYIVMPSVIWGAPKTKLITDGIQKPHSFLVPTIGKLALDCGQVCVVGKGLNQWNHTEINETADLFAILYDGVCSDPDGTRIGHGKNGYYIAENGEFNLMQVSVVMGEALHALDPSKPASVRSYTADEELKYFTDIHVWGSNSRAVGNHSRSLGWEPKLTTDDFLRNIPSELELWLKDGMPSDSQTIQINSK
ncbi:hypothetical protein VKT23_013781 [Stygiomarasmius scandens]|uniref:NmrA-like domain-containing protein n=1 Tax=Marasmiellus scandens TaxID=2682957 RepID=A0ABR1J2H8_9AGAR